VVLATGTSPVGGKTPAVTVPQVRAIFTALLREPTPSPARIADVVSRVLRRNEETRLYHWYRATGGFPPRRPPPGPRPRGRPPKPNPAQ
jgi:hypothetical protein